MQDTLRYFSELEDPRSFRNQKHPLTTLIGTTLLAALSGIDSFSGIADFTEAHLEQLEDYFDFPSGVPSHDTYQRLWDGIDPSAFYQSFCEFTRHIATLNSDLISLDGKEIRHSGQDKALHIVSAWCHANQMTLAQEKVDSKSNEITALPKLLALLDLNNRIVTIDAMGAQREICTLIKEQGGDYVISLKGNQGTLHQDVMTYFQNECLRAACCSNEENDKGHGRLEQRIAYACDDISWLQAHHQWPGLKSIGMIKSRVERKGKVLEEERFYLSSLSADAKKLNYAARAHWGIESVPQAHKKEVYHEEKLRACA